MGNIVNKQRRCRQIASPTEELIDGVRAGDAVKVKAALDMGGDPKTVAHIHKLTWGCLMTLAAVKGHSHLINLLIGCGLSVEGEGIHPQTPLTNAASWGHSEIVAALLTAGADPNVQDQYGRVALSSAAQRGHTSCVSLLLPLTHQNSRDPEGCTVAHYAAGSCDAAVMKQLKEAGGWDIAANSDFNRTPLHVAAYIGNLEAIQYLVEVCHLNPHSQDSAGDTPLQLMHGSKRDEAAQWLTVNHSS